MSAVDNSARSTNPDTKGVLWNGGKNEYYCEDTSGKVFLISEREATKGAFGFGAYDSYGAGSARIRMATDLDKVSASGGGIVPAVRLKAEAGAN